MDIRRNCFVEGRWNEKYKIPYFREAIVLKDVKLSKTYVLMNEKSSIKISTALHKYVLFIKSFPICPLIKTLSLCWIFSTYWIKIVLYCDVPKGSNISPPEMGLFNDPVGISRYTASHVRKTDKWYDKMDLGKRGCTLITSCMNKSRHHKNC